MQAVHVALYQDHTGARARGCFTCARFHGKSFHHHLACEHRSGAHVIGQPVNGCAHWEHDPGADDEQCGKAWKDATADI